MVPVKTRSAKTPSDCLTRSELRALSMPSDLRAVGVTLGNWALIAGAFACPILWTHPVSVLVSVLVLGGRQMSLAVMAHDCAHYAFFRTKVLNDWVGQWAFAGPMNFSLSAYRAQHLKHHRFAGTPQDPDRVFVANYPVERASLRRKFIRDLTGQTGVRDLIASLRRFNLGKRLPWVFFHSALFAGLFWAGVPWAYGLWWAAELLIYPALTRIRQIGEHGVALDRDSLDPRDNTATTLARFWERLLIAPNNVHYHLEHHLFAAVPSYRLPRLHRLLRARGYFDAHACLSEGYFNVLQRAVRAETPSPRCV